MTQSEAYGGSLRSKLYAKIKTNLKLKIKTNLKALESET